MQDVAFELIGFHVGFLPERFEDLPKAPLLRDERPHPEPTRMREPG